MIIRPLKREDLLQFWKLHEVPRTVRGFAVERDGEVLAVTGLMYLPNFILAFAEMPQDVQRYPVTVMKVARRMVELMRTVRAPVYCNAAEFLPNAPAFLAHIGFEQVQGRQFKWSSR